MASLVEALMRAAQMQRAEAAMILQQQAAVRGRQAAVKRAAAAFQTAAALAEPGHLRERLQFHVSFCERQAEVMAVEAATFEAERKRILKEAQTTERRAQMVSTRPAVRSGGLKAVRGDQLPHRRLAVARGQTTAR